MGKEDEKEKKERKKLEKGKEIEFGRKENQKNAIQKTGKRKRM